MSSPSRPLSPHLQVYRPEWTSVLSIAHRAAGVVLAVGALLVAWWLWSVAGGGDGYRIAHAFFASPAGKALLFAWTLATFYHLCNGVRHLCWDFAVGLELPAAFKSGVAVVVVTAALTAAAWIAR